MLKLNTKDVQRPWTTSTNLNTSYVEVKPNDIYTSVSVDFNLNTSYVEVKLNVNSKGIAYFIFKYILCWS